MQSSLYCVDIEAMKSVEEDWKDKRRPFLVSSDDNI
jgi:hypothetical protein